MFDQAEARQEQECDATEVTPAVITSPNHPKGYNKNSDCRYCVQSKAKGNTTSTYGTCYNVVLFRKFCLIGNQQLEIGQSKKLLSQ